MNEKNPEISIAMATFNGEKFLREQLDSILRQTFSDFELIISDDGSADETMAILTEYEKIDPRIKIVQNSGEHGVVQNFQNALKICRGKFIAFSDQDDVWTDDHLQTLLDVLGENFLACANADLVDKNLVPLGKTMGELTGAGGNFGESTIVRLVFQNFVQGATTLFRRELLDFLPVPHGTIHDFYFAVLACMLGKISYSPKSILKYRQHENNVIGAGLGKVQEKKSFKQKIKDKKLYKKNVQRNRTGALNLGFEIFPKVQEILPPEKSAEVYKKLSDAKKIVVYKNIFAFKKYYSVIFLDEKRFDKFLLRFFSRYVRGILLLF